MKNTGNIVLGILGAAAAGVVIGMIIAPQKGSDLRADIKNSAGDLTKKLGELLSKGKEKYDELRAMIVDEAKELKSGAKDLATEAGNAYNDFSAKAENAYDEYSEEAHKSNKKSKS